MFGLCLNPELDDQIFDCLVKREDVHASFLFVGDLSVHHQK